MLLARTPQAVREVAGRDAALFSHCQSRGVSVLGLTCSRCSINNFRKEKESLRAWAPLNLRTLEKHSASCLDTDLGTVYNPNTMNPLSRCLCKRGRKCSRQSVAASGPSWCGSFGSCICVAPPSLAYTASVAGEAEAHFC